MTFYCHCSTTQFLNVFAKLDNWMVGQKRENVWGSADFFPGEGQKSTFRLKNNNKDTIFRKKSKNIMFLACLGHPGGWGRWGKSPPCPHSGRPWLNVVDFMPPCILFQKLTLPISYSSMLFTLFSRCQNNLIHVLYFFLFKIHFSWKNFTSFSLLWTCQITTGCVKALFQH